MGLFGFRREVHLFWADSRRSAVEVDDEADDTASADSRTASAQGLYLSFILYKMNYECFGQSVSKKGMRALVLTGKRQINRTE